jgi:hypothetical protein
MVDVSKEKIFDASQQGTLTQIFLEKITEE